LVSKSVTSRTEWEPRQLSELVRDFRHDRLIVVVRLAVELAVEILGAEVLVLAGILDVLLKHLRP